MPRGYSGVEACFCRACMPTTAPVVCSRCGEEVRLGYRHGTKGWLHREDVDHHAILGHMATLKEAAKVDFELDMVRTRASEKTGKTQTYTARTYGLKGAALDAARENQEDNGDQWDPDELPEPEVRATPIDVGDDRMPRGAKTIINRARKAGWEVTASYARGPVAHGTTGKLLRIVDSVVVRARLADAPRVAVACWRTDAKGQHKFETAWIGTIIDNKTIHTEAANANILKMWIDGEEPE